jgi:hypothetical protein
MMISPEQAATAFRGWLESAESYAFLTRFVDVMCRYGHRMQGGQAGGVSSPRNSGRDHEEQDDLCHDFLLFVLDTYLKDHRQSPELLQLVLSGQYRRILELAWGRFLWHRGEQARSKQHNPRGYIYRRLREILHRDTSRFVVTSPLQGVLCYCPVAMATGPMQPPLPQGQDAGGHYSDWPPPPPAAGQKPEQYLFSSKWLSATAIFFWQEAASRHKTPVAMPIRELCRYIAEHYPWLNTPQRLEDKDSDLTEYLVGQQEPPEEHLQRINAFQSIAPLAAQLVATWPMEQQRVFALRLCDPPEKFTEIARNLGLADHNRAYALFQKSTKSLQRFTADWPGLPLAELPLEVAEAFIDEIKRLCKKSLFCP